MIFKNFRKRNYSNKDFLDNDKIYLSNEIDNFRSIIHSQLMSEFDKIKIKPNITFTQLKYFMKFQNNKL